MYAALELGIQTPELILFFQHFSSHIRRNWPVSLNLLRKMFKSILNTDIQIHASSKRPIKKMLMKVFSISLWPNHIRATFTTRTRVICNFNSKHINTLLTRDVLLYLLIPKCYWPEWECFNIHLHEKSLATGIHFCKSSPDDRANSRDTSTKA